MNRKIALSLPEGYFFLENLLKKGFTEMVIVDIITTVSNNF